MRHHIVGFMLATTALTLVGCSSSDSGQQGEAATSSTTATTAARTTAAAPQDPYEVYATGVTALGLTPSVKQDEAVSVAGNTCDNTVADMEGLVGGMHTLYPDPQKFAEFLTDRAHFIDAYCPGVRVVYDAATQKAAGVTVPPSR